MTLAGSVAAGRVLQRRYAWEQQQRRVAICVDFDDATDAAIRAGLPLERMLQRLASSGTTHVSLPELTLQRLLSHGLLAPQAPAAPLREPAPLGHWNYLHGPSQLVEYLAEEMCQRMPYSEARVLQENTRMLSSTLAFAGNLPALQGIGLGFDAAAAARIAAHALGVVPRPVSYDWPEKALLERTLAQAAQHGKLVAFAGDMILGHEMHLDETLEAMESNDLSFVYFAQSRHQKGDWFIAKRRAPHVVLGHQFSPADMIPLDYHAAAHNWVHLASEQGIRFCYVNFFRVLHATEPLEGLHYIEYMVEALHEAGFLVAAGVHQPQPTPRAQTSELALTALVPAGAVAAAASQTLRLSEGAALPLSIATAGGAVALPFLEHAWQRRTANRANGHHHNDHDHLDHVHDHNHAHHVDHDHDRSPKVQTHYPPSYSPKLLALAMAAVGPLLALRPNSEGEDWPLQLAYPIAAAASLGAVTSDLEYILRIEDYRGFGLDWLLPFAVASLQIEDGRTRWATVAVLCTSWVAARRRGDGDLLGALDAPHALGHTHHVSAATRLLGDLAIWLGPRPARKWAGVAPLALAARKVLHRRGQRGAANVAAYVSVASYALALSAFRQSQRHLALTSRGAAPGLAVGSALGALLEAMAR